jgi:hypothetical protein
MPRFAPETGYQESFSTRVGHPPNAAGYSDDQPDRSHFFRVQTIMKNGQIISGRYGKIQSDIGFDAMNSKTAYILFTYYFNPEINDRNMEFDPKQNLFQGFHEILSP